jgi:hypothetical protein
MGVEPTGGRAERPPSRFEDGEAHRGLYTSMTVVDLLRGCILPSLVVLVKPVKWRDVGGLSGVGIWGTCLIGEHGQGFLVWEGV